ncbi:P-loop containing nucleoside triphosphate hydrolase protein [Obelidium mucronatum]|nr:P-loop containing nucleoside triphosphate hydrolase protein [Obelidium mucronatum]
MQKGVNGSRVLELSSANPPLWLERGRVLVLTTPDKRRDLVFGYVSSARYKNMHGAFELTTCNALPEDNWTPPCRVEGRTLDINLTSYFVMLDALKKRAYSIQPGSISPITDVTLPTNTPSNPIDTRNYTYNLLHPLSSLNASQSLAVETALTQRVSLIHGAPTNQAVDSILSHFLATHSRNPEFKPNWGTIFRVGVRDQVLPAHHAYLPHSETRPAESRIDKRVYFAKLVFSTTLGGGLSVIASRKFDTVIVDEAAQVSHCVARVSVVKAKERCILVGDDKQLGPVTSGYNQTVDGENTSGVDHSNSSDGSEVSVIDDDRSLFEMHREDKRIPVVLLDEQYRMPKELMEFSNQTWYDGKIKSHSSTAKSPLQSPPFHGKKFIRFVNVDHGKETVGSESINGSVCNSAEAHLVKGIIESLWKEGYAAQVNLIRQVLGEVGLNFVDVGQERDVIIFSAVKTNGNLGFLKDYRRLNVMLTRARRGIIILGHEKTLRMDPVWSRLLDSI